MSMTLPIKKELALDSREVAEMVEKRHDNLLRDIETYDNYLTNSKMRTLDFFIPSNYLDAKGEERPNYQITKKGCEFIAHKLTGQKGAVFTATYINKFHEMEEALTAIHNGEPVSIKKGEQEKLFIQKQRAEAMLLNARTRQAKLIMEMQKISNLSPVAVELLGINAIEALTGKNIDYRPEIEKTYTATEIGREIGVSANKVGRIANANNLKTAEYGIEILDKSRHNDKQVNGFRYNEKGRARIIELFEIESEG